MLQKLPKPIKVILALCLVIALAIWAFDAKINSDLLEAKDQARKSGVALTVSDIENLIPEISAKENAAPILRQFLHFQKRATLEEAETYRDQFLSTLSPAQWKIIESMEPRVNKYSVLSEQLKDKEFVDFERDWNQGFETIFPEYQGMKQAVSNICLKSRLLSYRGDKIGALRELQKAFHLSQFAGREPATLSLHAQSSCELVAMRQLSILLGDGKLAQAELREIIKIRNTLRDPLPYSYFLQSDSACINLFYSNGKASQTVEEFGDKFPSARVLALLFKTPFAKVVHTDTLQLCTKVFKIASNTKLSNKEMISQLKAFDDAQEPIDSWNLRKVAASLPFVTYSDSFKAYLSIQANRNLLDTLLSGKAAIDPYTELPLKQIQEFQGTRFYTIGRNGIDDKGRTFDEKGKKILNADDISIFVHK